MGANIILQISLLTSSWYQLSS